MEKTIISQQVKIKQTADVIRLTSKATLFHISNNDIWHIAEAVKKVNDSKAMSVLLSFKAERDVLEILKQTLNL